MTKVWRERIIIKDVGTFTLNTGERAVIQREEEDGNGILYWHIHDGKLVEYAQNQLQIGFNTSKTIRAVLLNYD